jgi:hypothetical protein
LVNCEIKKKTGPNPPPPRIAKKMKKIERLIPFSSPIHRNNQKV